MGCICRLATWQDSRPLARAAGCAFRLSLPPPAQAAKRLTNHASWASSSPEATSISGRQTATQISLGHLSMKERRVITCKLRKCSRASAQGFDPSGAGIHANGRNVAPTDNAIRAGPEFYVSSAHPERRHEPARRQAGNVGCIRRLVTWQTRRPLAGAAGCASERLRSGKSFHCRQ